MAQRQSNLLFVLVALSILAIAACSRNPGQAPVSTTPDTLKFSNESVRSESTAVTAAIDPRVEAAVKLAGQAATQADADAMDKAVQELDAAGLLAETEKGLAAALSSAMAAGNAAPGLHLMLAAVYGRKGLVSKAYAEVQAAEVAAKAPGVSFSLAAIHGRLALLSPAGTGAFSVAVSCDVDGALVSLDGSSAVPTPAHFEGVRPGKHELLATMAGYDAQSAIVEGQAGDKRAIALKLVPALVPLSVVTDPAGADIYIDGQRLGSSPWSGSVRPGQRELDVRLEDYQSSVRAIALPVGSALHEESIQLIPKTSWISVTSEPAGANVYIDDKLVGITPLRHEIKGDIWIRVRVAHPFQKFSEPADRFVHVRPGKEYSEDFVLENNKAGVSILAGTGIPAGSRVFLNEKDMGVVPVVGLQIEYGNNTLEITADGYTPWKKTFIFAGALPQITLEKLAFAVPRRTIKVDGKADDWDGIAPIGGPDGATAWKSGNKGKVAALYLARDDSSLYCLIDTPNGRVSGYKYNLVFYNSVDASGKRNGALVAWYATADSTFNLDFDNWTSSAGSKRYSSGVSGRSSARYLEWKIPLSAIKLSSLELQFHIYSDPKKVDEWWPGNIGL